MSKEKEGEIEIPPASKSREEQAEEALEATRKKTSEHFQLEPGVTLEEAGIYWKAKNFEDHEVALKMHFVDRLRIISAQLDLKKENFQLAIGKNELSDELSWLEINNLIENLLKLFASDLPKLSPKDEEGSKNEANENFEEKITHLFGFPSGKYSNLMECVEKGVKFEKSS